MIKDLLDDYDIGLSYVNDTNTNRDNDKMVLQPKNEVVDYGGTRVNVFGKKTRQFIKRDIAEIKRHDVGETFYIKRILEDDRCSEEYYKLSKDREHLVIEKKYGRTLRLKLYKKKKELFALVSVRRYSIDETTGDFTYRATETSYRPYQVKMSKATLKLRNRIEERNGAEFLESIKNLNCISKMNNNRFIQVNKHITDKTYPTPTKVYEKWEKEHIDLVKGHPEGLLGDIDTSCIIRRKDIQECYDTQRDDHYHNFIIMRHEKGLTGRKMWDINIDKVGESKGSDIDKKYTKYTDADRNRWKCMTTYTEDDKRRWRAKKPYKHKLIIESPILIDETPIIKHQPPTINEQIITNKQILSYIQNC